MINMTNGFRRLRDSRSGIIAVWVGAATVLVAVVGHHLLTLPRNGGEWDDAYVYLRAASSLVSHPSHLYDPAHLQVVSAGPQPALVVPPSGLLPYLPLVPITRLAGLNAATVVWSLIDTGALIAALVLIGRRAGLGWLTLGSAAVAVGLGKPVRSEIASAQLNGVVLLFFALSLLTYPRLRSGIFMGCALAVKPAPLLLLLVPVLRRHPRLTGVAMIVLAVGNAVFLPFVGVGAGVFYITRVLPYMVTYVMHDSNNVSLPSVLQTWLGGGMLPRQGAFHVAIPHGAIATVTLLMTRIAVFVTWLRVTVDRRADEMVVLCLAVAMVPIFTATVWPHYLIYVLPLVLVTLNESRLWARGASALSLMAMLWPGRPDALWLSLGLLIPAIVGTLLGGPRSASALTSPA